MLTITWSLSCPHRKQRGAFISSVAADSCFVLALCGRSVAVPDRYITAETTTSQPLFLTEPVQPLISLVTDTQWWTHTSFMSPRFSGLLAVLHELSFLTRWTLTAPAFCNAEVETLLLQLNKAWLCMQTGRAQSTCFLERSTAHSSSRSIFDH
jgi:hypothetical protein